MFRFIQALRASWSLWDPGKPTLTPAYSGESWKDSFLCLLEMGKVYKKERKGQNSHMIRIRQSVNSLDWKEPQEVF